MMKKTWFSLILTVIMAVSLIMTSGCAKSENTNTSSSPADSVSEASKTSDDREESRALSEVSDSYQLSMPQEGDTVAVLHTSMGDISIKFFENEAPKTVENFLTHAKEGY